MFKVFFSNQAVKTLISLPQDIAQLIREAISQIAVNPHAFHSNVTKLKGRAGFRLRIRDWRVIYEVQKDVMVITVVKIARRGEVYR